MRSTRTFVLDFTHYLDDAGDVIQQPGPAQKLASFLAQIIEAVSKPPSPADAGIRCRIGKACQGTISAHRPPGGAEIHWHCPACGNDGVIRNWQNAKWDRSFDES